MRLVVFEQYRRKCLGVLAEEGRIVDVSAAAAAWLALAQHDPFWEQEVALRLPADVGRYLAGGLPSRRLLDSALEYARSKDDSLGINGEPLYVRAADVRLSRPITAPLMLSPGATFRGGPEPSAPERKQHREFFMRNPFNVLGSGAAVLLPQWLGGEFTVAPRLAVIISRTVRRASLAEAEEAIFGYCPALEVCAQETEIISWAGALFHVQYPHSRAFDGALTLGPAIVSKEEVGAVQELTVRLAIDGATAYEGRVPGRWDEFKEWICHLSESVTLAPGTVLIPGTSDDVFVQPARTGNLPVELVHEGFAGAVHLPPGSTVTIDIGRVGEFTVETAIEARQ